MAAYIVTVVDGDGDAFTGEPHEFRLDQEQEVKQFMVDQIQAGRTIYANFLYIAAGNLDDPADINIVIPEVSP